MILSAGRRDPFHGQHDTLLSVRSLLIAEPRWAAACGAWFAVLLAMLSGLTDWRVAVMVGATAFMLARAGDMLDNN
jgi:hypothetical protein